MNNLGNDIGVGLKVGSIIIDFPLSGVQVVSEASLTAEGFLPEDGSGLLVGLQNLAELESACLATGGGDVVLFNFNTCQVRRREKLHRVNFN